MSRGVGFGRLEKSRLSTRQNFWRGCYILRYFSRETYFNVLRKSEKILWLRLIYVPVSLFWSFVKFNYADTLKKYFKSILTELSSRHPWIRIKIQNWRINHTWKKITLRIEVWEYFVFFPIKKCLWQLYFRILFSCENLEPLIVLLTAVDDELLSVVRKSFCLWKNPL